LSTNIASIGLESVSLQLAQDISTSFDLPASRLHELELVPPMLYTHVRFVVLPATSTTDPSASELLSSVQVRLGDTQLARGLAAYLTEISAVQFVGKCANDQGLVGFYEVS